MLLVADLQRPRTNEEVNGDFFLPMVTMLPLEEQLRHVLNQRV